MTFPATFLSVNSSSPIAGVQIQISFKFLQSGEMETAFEKRRVSVDGKPN